MIPRIIHYCWFGRGEKSPLIRKCIRSWKRQCPDWEIIEWNEDNFDVNARLWTKQAYEAKKYAFVSDYVRLKALYEMGGVYLDTDVQLIKPLNAFLEHIAFIGFENKQSVATCVIGAQKRNPVIGTWMDWYQNRAYLRDGQPNTEPNVVFITEDLKSRGLTIDNTRQSLEGIEVYPQTWFCPQNIEGEDRVRSRHTVSIHYFDSSWRTPEGRRNLKREQFHSTKLYRGWEWVKILPQKTFRRIFGDDAMEKIKSALKK